MQKRVEIKTPCSMSWDGMEGSASVRHCSKCRFNVYNFSEMSQEEIDDLLSSGDRVCGRLFVRPDGTYMTKNCRAKVKRNRILKWTAAVALIPLSLILFISGKENKENYLGGLREMPVAGSVINFIFPPPPPEYEELMGDVCEELVPLEDLEDEIEGR